MHTGPSLVTHPLDELTLDGGESFHCRLTLWMIMHLSQTGACWQLGISCRVHPIHMWMYSFYILVTSSYYFFLSEVVFKEPWGEELV